MAKTPRGFEPEIKFVADWSDQRVFSDLGDVAKVDDPMHMLDQWRVRARAPGDGGAERGQPDDDGRPAQQVHARRAGA